jgi:hypothetical protein
MVVRVNKVISSEQPDDSIPVLQQGKSWDREIADVEMGKIDLCGWGETRASADSFPATAETPRRLVHPGCRNKKRTGGFFCPPVAVYGL